MVTSSPPTAMDPHFQNIMVNVNVNVNVIETGWVIEIIKGPAKPWLDATRSRGKNGEFIPSPGSDGYAPARRERIGRQNCRAPSLLRR